MLTRLIKTTLCCAALAFTQSAWADPLVRTDSGTIRGREASGIDMFLGIPFALPPVGDLRWRDPQPVRKWQGVRDAVRFSPACFQEGPPSTPEPPYTSEFLIGSDISEDCLYLNVWAAKNRAKRPVIVFIHGGAFQAGAASVPIYDGGDLARNGAVVVTLNYRLGVFGFLAHSQLSKESALGSSGNYGLLDIIAALRWVKANIARFGGDPANVTISGQSAGAIAVNQLLASPVAKGLFRQAIAESGPMLGLKMTPLSIVERGGDAFLKRFNATTVAELRARPANEIFATFRGPAYPLPPFIPVPVMDGRVVVSDPEIPTNTIVSSVPLVVGFNRYEAPDLPTNAVKFAASVRAQYGAFAERFLTEYPASTDAEASRSAGELTRDARIAGLLNWAKLRAQSSGERVYVYLFDHTYPGLDAARLKSFHTAEVPYIFGTFGLAAGPITEADRAVSRQMQSRWLAFLRRSDPSLPGSPWQDVQKAGARVMFLGDNPGQRLPMSDKRLALFGEFYASNGR